MKTSKPVIGVVLDFDDDSLKTSMLKYKIRENYFEAVSQAGGIPFGLPLFTERVEDYLDVVDGILVTGGCFESPDYWYINSNIEQKGDEEKVKSRRLEFDELLVKGALERDMPLLGICAGMQTLSVMGGYKILKSIKQEISEEAYIKHRKVGYDYSHDIDVVKNTKLREILGGENITVNSFHSEAVFQEPLGDSFLTTSAKSSEGIVEAVESKNHKFTIGVQWHPETHFKTDENSQKLFKLFIENCK